LILTGSELVLQCALLDSWKNKNKEFVFLFPKQEKFPILHCHLNECFKVLSDQIFKPATPHQ
jgi:hypothetical protein